ncbi:hypothetical protein GYMLUDRAFT_251295 [Collybiopsis luxurians FD-317 M1]|uniref:Uncharacterized protein n=1 Tax=Collybiopsis luxurians FD-317 M1 TaxID=944289 RepID=A0A0D0CBS2_9AGAR|nr:hypothetical protein GYMLUDRAFT_251295 [Collybiopsis luxurians FD-317 M1]
MSQLKNLTSQVVLELDELGLGPDVLHKLLVDRNNGGEGEGQEGKVLSVRAAESSKVPSHSSTVPVSRVSSVDSEASSSEGGEITSSLSEGLGIKNISLLWAVQRNAAIQNWAEDSPQITEVTEAECVASFIIDLLTLRVRVRPTEESQSSSAPVYHAPGALLSANVLYHWTTLSEVAQVVKQEWVIRGVEGKRVRNV